MPQRISGFVLGCLALSATLGGCAGTEGANVSAPSSTSASAPAGAPPAASQAPSPAPVLDGCPPDVNLMYEWLKVTPAIWNLLSKDTTGLLEPTCSQGWSMARTVVRNADPALVLFKIDPDTGKWNPVAVGTDNICDPLHVPADVQAKLGPGC